MGYCCGQINGDENLVQSKVFACADTGGGQHRLEILTDATKIVWFFKAEGQTIFTEIAAASNLNTYIFTEKGQYKAVVQGDNGSAIISGQIPCVVKPVTISDTPIWTGGGVTLVTPSDVVDTDEIMFARKNAAGQIVGWYSYPNKKYRNMVRGLPLSAAEPLHGLGIKNPETGTISTLKIDENGSNIWA